MRGQGEFVAGGGERERTVCMIAHAHRHVCGCVWDREKQETIITLWSHVKIISSGFH